MQFYAKEFFIGLWAIPLLILFFIYAGSVWKSRMRKLYQGEELRKEVLHGYRYGERRTRALLVIFIALLCIFALARPQWGDEKKKVKRKGVDVIFLLDTSKSMLAEDVKPNRFQKAKFEIENFVKKMQGDRIGIVAFAGSSFLQTPLTLDHAAFFLFLKSVDVGYVPDPGTSLANAIMRAMGSFPEKDLKHKAIIVLTDGEDHSERLDEAIERAKESETRIYTIGIGTTEGAPIPVKDERGRAQGYKKDRAGEIVITKLNGEVLENISNQTGAIYLPATRSEKEVDYILKHMETLGERQFEERLIVEKEDQFQIFLILALLLMAFEMLLRKTDPKKRKLGIQSISILFCVLIFSGFIKTPQSTVEDGNTHFENKEYQSAVDKYREIQVKNPDDPTVQYNLATSLYKLDQYKESSEQLKKASENEENPELQARALYNYGNSLYRLGDFEGALEAYKESLKINPDDEDAKYNLEFLQKKKDDIEDKEDERKENEEQNEDQQNQDQNQEQNDDQQQGGQGEQDQENQGQDNQDQQGGGQGDQQDEQSGQGQSDQQDSQGGGEKENQDHQQGQGDSQEQQNDQNRGQEEQNQDGGQGGRNDQENQGQDQGSENDRSDQGQNDGEQQEKDQSGGQDQGQNEPQEGEGQENEESEQEQDDPSEGNNEGNQPQNEPQDQQGDEPSGGGSQGNDQEQQQPQDPGGNQGGAGLDPGEQQQMGQVQAGSGGGQKPLQGQMRMSDALQLLDALHEGEMELQDLRKPPQDNKNRATYVEKDW